MKVTMKVTMQKMDEAGESFDQLIVRKMVLEKSYKMGKDWRGQNETGNGKRDSKMQNGIRKT